MELDSLLPPQRVGVDCRVVVVASQEKEMFVDGRFILVECRATQRPLNCGLNAYVLDFRRSWYT
jgi:hypothetical protein